MRKTCVSFFAGLAGFDLAFSRHGFEVTVQVEIEEACRKLEANKFPEAERIPDIRQINAVYRRFRKGKPIINYEKWKAIFKLLTDADVFCGGWPCQDLSVAGNRAGLSGERSGLWFALRRLIAIFRPAWFVGENVPGLLSSNEGRDFATVVSGLAQLRYWWSYRIFDAQFFGLAQRRERVFVVAGFGARSVAEILFEPESLCWDTPPSRETGQRVAPTIEGRAGRSGANNFATSGGLAHHSDSPVTANRIGGHHPRNCLDNETYVPTVARSLRATGNDKHREDSQSYVCMAHGQANAEIVSDGSPSLTCNHEAPILAFSSKDSGHDSQSDLSPTLRSMNFKDSHMNGGGQVAIAFKPSHYTRDKDGAPSEVTPPLSADADKGDQEPLVFDTSKITSKGNYSQPKESAHPPAIAFKPNQGAKSRSLGSSEKLSPTLEGAAGGNNKPAVCVRSTVRRLTPTECEILQGLPRGWTSNFSDTVRYRMIGNSVAIPCVEFIARRISKAIDDQRNRVISQSANESST